MTPETSPSKSWRETAEDMGVEPGLAGDDDPLADLRDREDELEAIAESDAPDAPVARMFLSLVREEGLAPEDVAAIHPGVGDDA